MSYKKMNKLFKVFKCIMEKPEIEKVSFMVTQNDCAFSEMIINSIPLQEYDNTNKNIFLNSLEKIILHFKDLQFSDSDIKDYIEKSFQDIKDQIITNVKAHPIVSVAEKCILANSQELQSKTLQILKDILGQFFVWPHSEVFYLQLTKDSLTFVREDDSIVFQFKHENNEGRKDETDNTNDSASTSGNSQLPASN